MTKREQRRDRRHTARDTPDRREKASAFRRLLPRRRAIRLALLFTLIAFAGTFLDRETGAFDLLERQTLSLRMALWKGINVDITSKARQRIVLVPISDETFRDPSFKALGGPPLPRSAHARVIHELQRAGASVIAFDMVFDIPRPGDKELAAAARQFGNVVWGGMWDGGRDQLLLPDAELRRASGHIGHTRSPHPDGDPDQIVDRIEAVITTEGREYPALSVEAVRLANGLGQEPLVRVGQHWHVGKWLIPTAADSTFRLSFLGPEGRDKVFPPTVAYELIYHGAANNDPFYRDNHFFRNKIVIIGDTTTLSRDSHNTPDGRKAGVEIHAHAIATLLERSFLSDAPPWFGPLAMMVLMAVACAMLIRLRWLVAAASAAVLLLCYFLGVIAVFVYTGLTLPIAMPCLVTLAMSLLVGIERGWTEERDRARMKSVLDQYVSNQISEEGAPTGQVALVFTDIENSSAMTQEFGHRFETARDDQFEILRNQLLAWNGFEVETAGDSLFAVFAKATDALQFAVHSQHDLGAHKWPEGIDIVRIRMGIHYGTPFVKRDRMKLTYRGNDTNKAARVSGMAKGGEILISGQMREITEPELQDTCSFTNHGTFNLKGVGDETLYRVQARDEVTKDLPG